MNKMLAFFDAKSTLSDAEKVGQLFMPAAFINDTEEGIQQLIKLIQDNCVGGLCFFHSRASAATNYEGKKKVVYNVQSFEVLKSLIRRYQKVAKIPLLIAIDAEWGLAMRIENTPQYPYAITLGAIQDHSALIFEVGKNIAHDCKAVGIHYNLSPVVDINNNPDNPVIGYRSFGNDKHKVTEKALAYIKGTRSEGILSSVKHFPGHGDTATDSHLGLPIIKKTKAELLNNELYPFQELINNGVDSVMVGHLSVPALSGGKNIPSSISKEIITDLLRNELGFNGVVISDALNMHAVSKNYPIEGELEWLAFDAGNDILCFAEHTKEGIEMILKNATKNQIEAAFERVWKLKQKALQVEIDSDSKLIDPTELNKKLALQSITLFSGTVDKITKFKDQGFSSISYSPIIDNHFIKEIEINYNFNQFLLKEESIDSIHKQIINKENILLSMFPPQVKPADNFGISDKEIQFINELLNTKNVVLYHFGNPYVLNMIDFEKAQVVVVVYQDFEVFQVNAGQHFLGTVEAKGKLPVALGI